MGNTWFCMAGPPRSDVVPYQAERLREFESKLVDVKKRPTSIPAAAAAAPLPARDMSPVKPAAAASPKPERRCTDDVDRSSVRHIFSRRLMTDLRKEQLKRASSKLEQARGSNQLAVVSDDVMMKMAMADDDADADEEKEDDEVELIEEMEDVVAQPAMVRNSKRTSWVELRDGAGETYFYDLLTREIAWDRPAEL